MAEPSLTAALMFLALMPSSGGLDPRDGPQCRVPATLPIPKIERPSSSSEVRRMPIGGYTLALSWSPEYCAPKSKSSDMQCDQRHGRFGFILHGLWPDGKNGRNWPQYCAPASIVPTKVLAAQFCTQPSVQLMQHEWAKHGTCMERRPEDYFAKARQLYQQISFPNMEALSNSGRITAGTLRDAFVKANSALEKEMIRVRATQTGMLSEVWICLDMSFKPTKCPAGKGGLRSSGLIRIRS